MINLKKIIGGLNDNENSHYLQPWVFLLEKWLTITK